MSYRYTEEYLTEWKRMNMVKALKAKHGDALGEEFKDAPLSWLELGFPVLAKYGPGVVYIEQLGEFLTQHPGEKDRFRNAVMNLNSKYYATSQFATAFSGLAVMIEVLNYLPVPRDLVVEWLNLDDPIENTMESLGLFSAMTVRDFVDRRIFTMEHYDILTDCVRSQGFILHPEDIGDGHNGESEVEPIEKSGVDESFDLNGFDF